MRLYVLLNGCYSSEHIVGIYSSQENAEMAARIFTDDAHIEEYELDAEVANMRRDYVPWFLRLQRESGNVLEVEKRDSAYGAFSLDVGEDVHRNLTTFCWAPSREHAIKIASERRRAFLAGEPIPVDAVDPVDGIVAGGPRAKETA